MNEEIQIRFDSPEEFLSHAQALEQELVQRFEEMSSCMAIHNNLPVSKLFQRLSHYAKHHADELSRQASGLELPKVAPWEYQWLGITVTEHCMEDTHYLMTEQQALELALRIEAASRRFYQLTREGSSVNSVKVLADGILVLKDELLQRLERWLAQLTDAGVFPVEDLDPPNIPE